MNEEKKLCRIYIRVSTEDQARMAFVLQCDICDLLKYNKNK